MCGQSMKKDYIYLRPQSAQTNDTSAKHVWFTHILQDVIYAEFVRMLCSEGVQFVLKREEQSFRRGLR
jgi:hypothetical protein